MAASNRQWGVTPPISTSLPTPAELLANDTLIAELKRQNNFEGSDETERRLRVLRSSFELLADDEIIRKNTLHLIQEITVEFVRHVSKLRNLSQAAIDAAGGKIFTFGSYRLGVYGPGELAIFYSSLSHRF